MVNIKLFKNFLEDNILESRYIGNFDSSLKWDSLDNIVSKIRKLINIGIEDTADVEGLIISLEDKLSSYDKEVIETVIDMLLFSHVDINDYDIKSSIIKLGDNMMRLYGTEPVMVKNAFEDAFYEISDHYNIDESIFINEGKNEPTDPKLWSQCKSWAKSKYDVWPSAYACGAASKRYKSKGGKWRKKKK